MTEGSLTAGALPAPRRLVDASWLNRRCLFAGGAVCAAVSVYLIAAGVVLHTTNGLTSDQGEQLALDFINYFAGAKAAASATPWLVYDAAWFHALEDALTGPGLPRIYVYPPIALLLSLPLALLSFVPALILWSLTGAGLGFGLLRRLVGGPAAALAVIGTPAGFFDLYGGQNGYFSAALLVGGLGLIERRPLLAGICFGCLSYKPQMTLLLPVALLAGGRWRVLAAAAATVAVLTVASLVLFGSATWAAFLDQASVQRHIFEFTTGFWRRMPTVFAAARQAGLAVPLAYGLQLASAAAAAAAVVAVWRGPAASELKAAVLAVAMFLASPFAWDYDSVILLFAAAWLGREGQRSGFLPGERLAIVALLVLPLPSFVAGVYLQAQPGPLVLWPVFALLLRRAFDRRGAVTTAGR